MTNVKTVRKGEVIAKEGDKIVNLILIQSGGVQLFIQRVKKNIELGQLGPSQVLGESALSGTTSQFGYSAMATTETKYIEIPVDVYKQQIETSQQMIKVLVKSLNDRVKQNFTELKNIKLEKDMAPMPDDQLAKSLASIFYSVTSKVKKEKNSYSMDYIQLRQYAQRVFGESPKRLEQVLNLLVKLKDAKYIMGKAPDDLEGPDQIIGVEFLNLEDLEKIFEFWQYNYFKNGRNDTLKIDDATFQVLMVLIKLCEGQTPDRIGAVHLDYGKMSEAFKNDYGIQFMPDHLTRLETRGLLAKRQVMSTGVVDFAFDYTEFKDRLKIWRYIREIEKWNEKGFVDMQEPELGFPKKKDAIAGDAKCPTCQASVSVTQKFCGECGAKLQ